MYYIRLSARYPHHLTLGTDLMTITSGHFTLTPSQRRFKNALEDYPRLVGFWDFDKRECDIEALREALRVMSYGEQIMARFFCGVWTGENTLSFDLIEAAKHLDETEHQVVLQWFAKPEFP
ncbi:MAG: hypothetical protein AB8B81_22785 [Halioglobus sp.]